MVTGEFLAVLKLHHIRRRISLGLALLFGAALAVAFFHQATEIHGYCSEHGEQIHSDHAPRGHSARNRDTLRHAPEHVRGVHGCSFLLFLAQSQEVQQMASGAGAFAADLDLDVGPRVAILASISLLALSPKTSPPSG